MSKFGDVREQSADDEIYPLVVQRVERYSEGGVMMKRFDRILYPDGKHYDLPDGMSGYSWAKSFMQHYGSVFA